MTFFTVQNDMGEVYRGPQKLPDGLEVDKWRDRIELELGNIVGSNGITVHPIIVDGVEQQSLVIDINPGKDVDARLVRVSDAIGAIAAAANSK